MQTGFNASKAGFVPVGALSGVNLVRREGEESKALNSWYNGPTLVDLIGEIPEDLHVDQRAKYIPRQTRAP